jgi:phosphoribosyl 1,2-cyclic phosphodiesterase
MRVRFYGVRGSIPTPGPSTVRYGGNSVCVEVRLCDDTRVILDAGTGIRECGNQMAREGYTGTIIGA